MFHAYLVVGRGVKYPTVVFILRFSRPAFQRFEQLLTNTSVLRTNGTSYEPLPLAPELQAVESAMPGCDGCSVLQLSSARLDLLSTRSITDHNKLEEGCSRIGRRERAGYSGEGGLQGTKTICSLQTMVKKLFSGLSSPTSGTPAQSVPLSTTNTPLSCAAEM